MTLTTRKKCAILPIVTAKAKTADVKALAEFIRDETEGGLKVARKLMAVLDGTARTADQRCPMIKEQLDAAKVLLERGWGAPKQDLDADALQGVTIQINGLLSEHDVAGARVVLPRLPTNSQPEEAN